MFLVKKDTKAYEIINSNHVKSDTVNHEMYFIVNNNELKEKIRKHSPYFDFVFDDDGNLIDIEPTERPMEIIENEEIDEEKIAMAEAIIDLDNRLKALEGGD